MKGFILKLGFKASAEQFAPRELLEYAVLAEQVGLDSVWISDHFQPWRHNGGHAPFSLAWLGALGARTSRIVIGTSVLTPTFRYHPSIIAQAFATLGSLFPERVVLGAGTGESLNEVPSSGLKWPEQKERTARFREAIQLIKALWSGDRVSFDGQFYKTQLATIYDRPVKPVPIYIAGAGPFMAKLAGLEGDGFICTSGKKWELYTETLLPNLNAGLGASGRSQSADYDKMIELKVSFDTDRQRALEDTRYWGALALTADEKINVEDPLQLERLADSLPLERAASRWIVTDDADEMIERIGVYIKLGFNHLVFHAPGRDQARFLQLFAQQVAPGLRRQFA
jgi:coenzyme F420-dependent glucose-6-phosphate dehydrogenase